MSDLTAWVTESGAECLLHGDGPVRVMPDECEETGFTVELVAATEVASLRADVDLMRDALIRNGFVRCDIPACNCGSWHARFGLPERMAELKQLLDDAGQPCGKCGHAGVYRRFVGQGERMESKEYNRSPSKYASGQCHGYSAYRDHLQNICQCCGYVWQTLPLAKKRKTTTGVGGAA